MATKKLKAGVQAPLFTLESYNLGTINLKETYEKKTTVIIFSRYFGCSICQWELDLLLPKLPQFQEKGVDFLYITQSGEEIAKQFIKDKNIPIPVIPSTKDELYKNYGLKMFTLASITKVPKLLPKVKEAGYEHGEYEGWENQCPGQVVIDKLGTIQYYHKGWLELEKLEDFLQSL